MLVYCTDIPRCTVNKTLSFCAVHVSLDLISQTELHYIRFAHYISFMVRLVITHYLQPKSLACSTQDGENKQIQIDFSCSSEGKRSYGRHRCRWKDNVKTDLKEIGWDGQDWINLAQVTKNLQALCARWWTMELHKMRKIWLPGKLVVSEEGICCVYTNTNTNNNNPLSLLYTRLAVYKGIRVSLTNNSYSLFCQILSTVRHVLSITAFCVRIHTEGRALSGFKVPCGLFEKTPVVGVIKSRRMKSVRHVARMGEGRGVYRFLMRKPKGKRPLGRPRRRWG
jgi:hypothetical protein